jgi:hypothetical protein
MIFRILILALMLTSSLSFASRAPAVEDFVGIEVEHPKDIPQGTEGLFNFEKEIVEFDTLKSVPQKTSKAAQNITHSEVKSLPGYMGIIFILVLPLLTFLLMMSHLRRKAEAESEANIEVLEKYRKAREEKKRHDHNKAS